MDTAENSLDTIASYIILASPCVLPRRLTALQYDLRPYCAFAIAEAAEIPIPVSHRSKIGAPPAVGGHTHLAVEHAGEVRLIGKAAGDGNFR